MKSVQIRARADRKQASEAEENVQLYSAHWISFLHESPYFYILFYNTARVSVRKQAGRVYMEELRDPSLLLIINFEGKNKWK